VLGFGGLVCASVGCFVCALRRECNNPMQLTNAAGELWFLL
jgi:hypothetical protein